MSKDRIKVLLEIILFSVALGGCGNVKEQNDEIQTVVFPQKQQESEPIIIREEKQSQTVQSEELESQTQEETEQTLADDFVYFADRQQVSYGLEVKEYTQGESIHIRYFEITGMSDINLQEKINMHIEQSLIPTQEELLGCTMYEAGYEVATQGSGVLSVILRGQLCYEQSAYPLNIVKTVNIDMTNGENLRLKDYADMEGIVFALENNQNYQIVSNGVEQSDFDMFMNNGYVTDYAMTLLDYDIDFSNLSFQPSGYSAIRDNHVVLFVEAEHVMGDYVELIFEGEL